MLAPSLLFASALVAAPSAGAKPDPQLSAAKPLGPFTSYVSERGSSFDLEDGTPIAHVTIYSANPEGRGYISNRGPIAHLGDTYVLNGRSGFERKPGGYLEGGIAVINGSRWWPFDCAEVKTAAQEICHAAETSGAKGLYRELMLASSRGPEASVRLFGALVSSEPSDFVGLWRFGLGELGIDEPCEALERVIAQVSGRRCATELDCFYAGQCGGEPGACVAVGPEDCKGSVMCALYGMCEAIDGRCRATAPAACKASVGCKTEGRCGWHEKARVCIVDRAEDCARSLECRRTGRCQLVDGRCEATSKKDCDALCKSRGFCELGKFGCIPQSSPSAK